MFFAAFTRKLFLHDVNSISAHCFVLPIRSFLILNDDLTQESISEFETVENFLIMIVFFAVGELTYKKSRLLAKDLIVF